jgi:hypothetical protein
VVADAEGVKAEGANRPFLIGRRDASTLALLNLGLAALAAAGGGGGKRAKEKVRGWFGNTVRGMR